MEAIVEAWCRNVGALKRCRAFAPASVANVACGFDVLGIGLREPGDTVEAEISEVPGVTLTSIEGDGGKLPRNSEQNTASIAAQRLLQNYGESSRAVPGVRLKLIKGLPLASGLGSSAASAVAAVVATHHLLGGEMPRHELLQCAMEGERAVAGSAHADNAAACLYGGFVLVRDAQAGDVVRLPIPKGLSVAVARPHLALSTKDSRALLGDQLPLTTAVQQWANVGSLVAALYQSDWELMGRSLSDAVAEPVRSKHIPGFQKVKRAALDDGAVGCSISGSGPSVFALCRCLDDAERVSQSMCLAFAEAAELEADAYASPVDTLGAHVLEEA